MSTRVLWVLAGIAMITWIIPGIGFVVSVIGIVGALKNIFTNKKNDAVSIITLAIFTSSLLLSSVYTLGKVLNFIFQ